MVFDINDESEASSPADLKGQSIPELLKPTFIALITREESGLVRDPFYSDYAGMISRPDAILFLVFYSCP